MKIREITFADKDNWIKLVELSDNRDKEWAEQKFESYINSKDKKRLLVVEENGNLVGFSGIKGENLGENVSVALNNDYALITWVALIPEYRKKGIGSKILRECDKYAVKWNKKGIWTGCRDKVIPFYEKSGFIKSGTFINDKGQIENLMVKEIKWLHHLSE